MKKLNVIDLFSGCGGLSDGFEQAGFFRTIACMEWEKAPHLSHIKRLKAKWGYKTAEKMALRFDIQRTEELLHGWKNDPVYDSSDGLDALVADNNIDIVIGGPPCQAYSLAGRIRDEHGMKNDYRNYLFESYLAVVKHYKPNMVIFENVPGILSACPGDVSIIDRINEAFDEAGYELTSDLSGKAKVDLVDFGIPQRRSRVILFGIKKTTFKENRQKLLSDFYDNILTQYHTSIMGTVRDAIGDLPPFYPSKETYKIEGRNFSHTPSQSVVLNHAPRYHNQRDISIFRDLADDIEKKENRYSSIKSLHELYKERTGKDSNIHKYYVLRWNEPSNTIPAHLYKDGLRHIHPDPKQSRSITVREAARLQTFDDDFEFLGSVGDQYKMIGNAVPPLFAKYLACAVYEFSEKIGLVYA